MADSKELKPVSFRIDEETKEKIKEIAISTGGNQQETMQLLINAYYMQTQKVELVEHKATIEEFERCTTNLIQMFTGSLKANHDLRESVMQEFSATLESKDQIIQDLQEKVKTVTEKKDEATEKAKSYSDQVVELIKQVDDLEKMLKDKQDLNDELKSKNQDLKEKFVDMMGEISEMAIMRSNLAKITAECDKMKKSLSDAEEAVKRANMDSERALNQQKQQLELMNEKAMLEADRKHDEEIRKMKVEQQQELKAMLDAERMNDEKIRKMKTEHQQEIDRYQQKYLSLLEKMEQQEKTSKK